MHKILCTIDPVTDEAKKILTALGEVTFLRPSQEKLPTAAKDCTCLVIQLGLTVDKGVIDACPTLKMIATATTGIDHIDVAYAEKKDIIVISLQGERGFLTGITSTAELALGLMIALARKIVPAVGAVQKGMWEREPFRGTQLFGKTLGLAGVGRLGTMMAHYGTALGMRVIGFDRTPPAASICLPVSFQALLKESDVISIHLPLTPETTNLFDAAALAHMKSIALLINTSRGEIVSEDAVMAALKKKALGGYATDVLSGETAFAGNDAAHPLVQYAKTHENVLITPHIGGTTAEARAATDVFLARKLRDFLNGKSYHPHA